MTIKSKIYGIAAGLLFGATGVVCADTLVTFQVDMSAQISSATFNPATDTVYARGSFNGWGNFVLTNNPSGDNTNLYTGTFDDTADTNGGALQYKFATATLGYEATANGPGDNRATRLPTTSGGSLVLPAQFFSDAGSPVVNPAVFQVDMSQQIALGNFDTNTDTVEVQGDFEGWSTGYTLNNDPTILVTNQYGLVSSNVYVGTFDLAGSPGQVNEFKYVIQPIGQYESPSALNGVGGNNNRYVFNEPQTLPIVAFSDQPFAPIVTNNVTFSVDMTAQVLSGFFDPSADTVTLRGAFNGWNTTATVCTNNPSADNTNIYSVVISNMVSGAGAEVTQFKFGFNPNSINNSYENNASVAYAGNPPVLFNGGNRVFDMPNINNSQIILPVVYYNDESTYSVLPAATTVTFNVNMTNAVGTDAHVFDPSVDSVYLNGLVLTNPVGSYAFAPWTNSPAGNPLGAFQMTNNPVGSEIYTLQLTIPAGYPVALSYQYSINGNPDEANSVNHLRYIRSTGNYVISDVFGSMIQEQSFGNLAVGPKSGVNVPITWLGRPGVHLQTRTNLVTGSWIDLPGTDAQSSTNYPTGAGATFFRLINPF